jgi:two-component system sensor histidine kinase/response regulator
MKTKIRQSLDIRDYETAERLAHTAKGVGGNIGAVELQKLAARVEKAIKERDTLEAIESIIIPYADAHGRLIADLKEALPTLAAGGGGGYR